MKLSLSSAMLSRDGDSNFRGRKEVRGAEKKQLQKEKNKRRK